MQLLALLAALPAALAVLPPGYEDYMFCWVYDHANPPCRVPVEHPRGFVGPKSMFWQCFYRNGFLSGNSDVSLPANWTGHMVGDDKWHALLKENEGHALVWGQASGDDDSEIRLQAHVDSSDGAVLTFPVLSVCDPVVEANSTGFFFLLACLAGAWIMVALWRWFRKPQQAGVINTPLTHVSYQQVDG